MTNNKAFRLIAGLGRWVESIKKLLALPMSVEKLVIVVASFIMVLGFIPWLLPFRTSQEVAAKLAAIVLISFFLIKDWWLKLFLVYCTVMVFIKTSPQGLIVLQTMAIYFILFQVIADKLNRDRKKFLVDVICMIGIVQCAMVVLQYLGIFFMILPINCGREDLYLWQNTMFNTKIFLTPSDVHHNLTGFTSNPNMSSGLLALCFPAFLRKGWYWWVPLLILCVLAVGNLQGIFAVMLILVIYIIIKLPRKFKALFLVSSIVLIGLYLFITGEWVSFIEAKRLHIWIYYITNLIPLRPIEGVGVGLCQYFAMKIKTALGLNVLYAHPHNEFIGLFIETGAIGFSLIMAYLITNIRKFCFRLNSFNIIVILGAISGILNCMVSFTVHVTIGIVLLFYLSIMQHENQTEVVE